MLYGIEAVILVEIGELTFRIANMNLSMNEGNHRIELNLIEERREVVVIKDATLKRKIVARCWISPGVTFCPTFP